MKFGVVIVTYNRIKLLKECIHACLNQTYKFSSIIIVNNCSTDGTYEYLKSQKDKRIKVINCEKNIGGAGGFYEGIKEAKRSDNVDYLLIIDDDAIIEKDCNKKIKKAIDFTMSKNEKIYAYSTTVKTDNVILTSTRKNINEKFKFVYCDIELYNNDYFDYQSSSFCGLYLSINIIKKIGLPKKDFFIWYDDTEYSLRINKYTMIRNVNSAIIDHKSPLVENTGVSWKSYYGIRNKLFIEKKYFPKKIYLLHIAKNLFKIAKVFLKYLLTRNKKCKYMSKIVFYATFDFIRNKYGFNEKIGFLTIK